MLCLTLTPNKPLRFTVAEGGHLHIGSLIYCGEAPRKTRTARFSFIVGGSGALFDMPEGEETVLVIAGRTSRVRVSRQRAGQAWLAIAAPADVQVYREDAKQRTA